MNNPSPFVPQGSLPELKNKSRARVKFAVFFVISINVVVLMALLISGCRKPPEPALEPVDTNALVPEPNVLPAEPEVPTNVVPEPVAVTPLPPEPPVPQAQEYVVVKGDSFYTIAKKFGVTIKAIQDANPGVDPKKLQINQRLQIPAAVPPPAPTYGTTPDAAASSIYTVKSGDTLTKIAAEHGTTVKALRSENNLTTDKIKVGDKLKIPAKPAAPEMAPAPVMETPVAPAPAPTTTPAGQ